MLLTHVLARRRRVRGATPTATLRHPASLRPSLHIHVQSFARFNEITYLVEKTDVLRRYKRGWSNFLEVYGPLADHWAIYDNSELTPQLRERGP
jgi:hypothetical protein